MALTDPSGLGARERTDLSHHTLANLDGRSCLATQRHQPGHERLFQSGALEATFAGKTRGEWTGIYARTDACVSPVLAYDEVMEHPHMAARGTLTRAGGFDHPGLAPRFGSGAPETAIPEDGAHSNEILASLGYAPDDIAALAEAGAIRDSNERTDP